jgi:hypothetical protein
MAGKAIEIEAGTAGMLVWVASLGAITAEALARREDRSVASARGRLLAAERSGAMRSWRPLRDRPALYTATAAGLRSIGLGRARPGQVSAAGAAHAVVCCEAAIALERSFPTSRVVGEPEIRSSDGAAAATRASVPLGGRSGPSTHRADLAILPADRSNGRPVAVEVELTVKAPRRLEAICRAWARSRQVAGVIYVVSPPVCPAVERAVAVAQAQAQIAVVDLAGLETGRPSGASA